ncbi:tetratricopeptide repeat protein [Myxococcus sp. CA039A]|uniref:tetratricopeptide repeat protein n=1 Tax=Myxococcus sp. CA039A TaxID=2741737 RepID=UPI00157A3A59|nr:tetratricopeptide repeat protein [Myxococcus sp. CA039A]NTX57371.1 tetratricopeptide repeat protein [Myxococcus sp. CA039A]
MHHQLRILHISDLHIRGDLEKEAWRRRRVLGDAWMRNLDDILADGPIDLVAFTGDLAFSGRPVEYEGVLQFLDQVLTRLKCSRERLFLVPGNHDVDRSIASASWKKLRRLLRSSDAQEFSQWMASQKDWAPRGFRASMRDEVLSRQAAYREWVDKVLGRPGLLPSAALHPRLGYRETVHLPGHPFAVHLIGLDSAWLAGDDNDTGRLWLTDDQVMRLATDEGRELDGLRVALIHHPLDQLMDGAHARRLLAGHVDLLLRGHLHEPEALRSEEPSSALRSLAAGCLYDSDRYPNSFQVIQLTLGGTGRPESCDVLFRTWSSRGSFWFNDNGQYAGSRGGRIRWWGPAAVDTPVPPRVGVFVGRQAQLMALANALLPEKGEPRPVAIQGMPGVGKSYLVGQFFRERTGRFPGGFQRLPFQSGQELKADGLLREVADRLGVTAEPEGLAVAVRERLRLSPALLVIDNVDGPAEAASAADVVRRLAGCPVIVSGRLQGFGDSAGWEVISLRPLESGHALEQLSKEFRPPRDGDEAEGFARFVRELGHLPLAIHLASGYLRRGHTTDGFLAQLRRKGLAVGPADKASELLSEGASRAVLRTSLEISLEALRALLHEEWGSEAPRFLGGMAALGHAPAAGVGRSLGAALAGLTEDEFASLVVQAVELSIIEKVPLEEAPQQDTWRAHPLLAALLREGTGQDVVVARMTEWFIAQLPDESGDSEAQGKRWRLLTLEGTSLGAWLHQVPATEVERVINAGSTYARVNGPFLSWAAFCERALLELIDPNVRSLTLALQAAVSMSAGVMDRALAAARELQTLARSQRTEWFEGIALGTIAEVLRVRGEPNEALRIFRKEALPIYERLGDVHGRAVALGKVASILDDRGEPDEALRILREEVLPVYEQLGDVRGRAVALGKVADILEARGELDEALLLLREEVLPGCRRLGDVRSGSVALGKVADILVARGELDEALRILREEVVPVFERLGDVRSRAVALGKVADALESRGEPDEALRIRREEEIPVYERLGDVRALASTLRQVADILDARGEPIESLRILREEVLPIYERLGDVGGRAITLSKMTDILSTRGEKDEALRILREEVLPVYERLGDVSSQAVNLTKVADILQARGEPDEALRILRERVLPVFERLGDMHFRAITLGKIADILHARGEPDEALRIRLKEEIPVYERLGNMRNQAVTFAKVADTLEARGEQAEALRILREKALPVYERLGDARARAIVSGKVAAILSAGGKPDEALRILREEVVPVFERLGDVRSRAVALGKVADALESRGEPDEALRIRREEEIPVYERLGNVRGLAGTLSKIASTLQAQGELDEALRILREEVIPICEQLGDVRARAVTLGKVADILDDRGELDEALRIHCEEELPVYSRLGDMGSKAITLVQIATILSARGDQAEALRILREEVLPICAQLGDVRGRAIALGKVADILATCGELDEALRILREEALPICEQMGDARGRAVNLGVVAEILTARGELDEALRMLRDEVLPICEQIGDARGRAITLRKVANILATCGELDEALRMLRDEVLPICEQIGDARGRAVTLARVAEILEGRGELDEALRIRREEMHPILKWLPSASPTGIAPAALTPPLVAPKKHLP